MKIYIDTTTGTWGEASGLRIVDLDAVAANDGEDTDAYSYLAFLESGLSDSEINRFGREHGTHYDEFRKATIVFTDKLNVSVNVFGYELDASIERLDRKNKPSVRRYGNSVLALVGRFMVDVSVNKYDAVRDEPTTFDTWSQEAASTCILTGEEGENPDDCTTHDHE